MNWLRNVCTEADSARLPPPQLARQEVELAAKFDHPNVMRVFSLNATDGVVAACLELASGGDLASRVMKDKGMDAKEVGMLLSRGSSFFV